MLKLNKMKKYLLLLLSIGFFACSSDDDSSSNGNGGQEPNQKNYFPLVEGNEWDYANMVSSSEDGNNETTEKLSVEEELQTESGSRFRLSSTSDDANFSITGILSNGIIYKENSKLLLTGGFDLDLEDIEAFPDFGIDFEDLVIFDADANLGSIIFNDERDVTLPEFNNITLSIDIQIQSTSLGSMDSMEVDGTTYEDVISSSFVVTIEGTASVVVPPIPFPISLNIIEKQDFVSSVNFFANEVGLIQSETDINLEFADFGDQLPVELPDISASILQQLTTFNVTLE